MNSRKIAIDRPMQPRRRVILILLLVLSALTVGAQEQRPIMVISSYVDDGSPYPLFGDELAKYLNDRFGDRFQFVNRESAGSVANLQNLLLNEDVAFAIVQEDVAHYFYTGQSNEFFFADRSDDMRITALTRLFLEEVYLLVRPGITSLREIGSMYVGEPLSGTYATYTNYREYHRPSWTEVQSGDRLQLLRDGEVDAVFEVSSTPHAEILEFATTTACSLMPIRRPEVSLNLDLYRATTIPDSLSPGGQATSTVSVPALLLAKRTVPREVAQAVIAALFDESARRRTFPATWSYLEALDFATDRSHPRFADAHMIRLPVPPHPAVVVSTLGRFPYWDFVMLAAFFLLLGFLVIWVPRTSRFFWRLLRSSEVRRLVHQGIGFVIATLVWAVFACWGIKFHEIRGLASGATLVDSAFVHMKAIGLLLWATIFSFTGYEDTAFPLMGMGKILAVSIHVVGLALVGWLGARVVGYIAAHIMMRRKDMDLSKKTGHVVIANWNEQGPRLIEELRVDDVPADRRDRDIIVLATDPVYAVPIDAHDGVFHKTMDPWDLDAFDKVNLLAADSVIILSPSVDGSDDDADGIALRTALAIRRYCTEKSEGENGVKPKVLAQLRGPKAAHVIQEVGIDEFVCSGNLGARILAQAVISPGITEFFTEILTQKPDSNEVYSQFMPEALCTGEADFWRVVEYFVAQNDEHNPALPIGLRVLDKSQNNGHKITLLNPTREMLRLHAVDQFTKDDAVIVFADNAPA